MADKRRKNKRLQDQPQNPSKEDYAIADHLRFNVPTRDGKLQGLPVICFYASKAVDALLDSKWATKKGKTEAKFTTRQSCVDYCHELLMKGLFHRGLRTDKKKDKDKKGKKIEGKEEKSEKSKKSKKKEEKENEEKITESDKENKEKEADKKSSEKKDDGKKKKKKMKIEMHDDQIFVDGDEIYVWIHDPTPFKNKVIGLFLVLGSIGVCLFPLWPPEVRLGVYYLSLAAACFVGFILVLCIIRVIMFCIVWGLTMGKHHFWLLPNLTEDVGFFDSFKPLYKHERSEEEAPDTKSDDNKTEESTGKKAEKEDVNIVPNTAEEEVGDDDENVETDNKNISENDDNVEREGSEASNNTEGNNSDSNGYEVVSHQDLDKDNSSNI